MKGIVNGIAGVTVSTISENKKMKSWPKSMIKQWKKKFGEKYEWKRVLSERDWWHIW